MKTGTIETWKTSIFNNLKSNLVKSNGNVEPVAFFLKEKEVAQDPKCGVIPLGFLFSMTGPDHGLGFVKNITKSENASCVLVISQGMMHHIIDNSESELEEIIVLNLDTPFFSKTEMYKIERDDNNKFIKIKKINPPEVGSLFNMVDQINGTVGDTKFNMN